MHIPAINFFLKRKIITGFKVNKTDLVLDIGSGNKPFWRADVFLDSLKFSNVQRHNNEKTIHNLGTFVDSDVSKMPFKDNTFDFSFCSHLLEHVEDPAKVIKEIQRVSRRGYIEVPNGIIESIRPFKSHLWFIYLVDETLYFVRKSKQMHNILSKNGLLFHTLVEKVDEPFIRLYWENKINYKIIRDASFTEYKVPKTTGKSENENSFSIYILLVRVLRLFFYKNKSIDLNKMLRKPR